MHQISILLLRMSIGDRKRLVEMGIALWKAISEQNASQDRSFCMLMETDQPITLARADSREKKKNGHEVVTVLRRPLLTCWCPRSPFYCPPCLPTFPVHRPVRKQETQAHSLGYHLCSHLRVPHAATAQTVAQCPYYRDRRQQ